MKKRKTKDSDGQQKLPGLLVEDWQKVFDVMAIGITASDKNGHFEIFNSKMQAITGYTLEQANTCGDFSRLIYPAPLERREALERLNEIMQKPECPEIETQIHAKDGTKKILAVSTSLINYKDRVMFLSVYRDVTKRVKTEQSLKQVKDELEIQAWGLQKTNDGIKVLYKELKEQTREISKLAQAKSAFTSMVSHELRTPLSSLKESVSQVLEGMLGTINEGQRKLLDIAKRNVDRLARLITEVLDFQTLETGKMVFKIQDNDINEVVKETEETMNIISKEKGLHFTLNLDKELPKIKFDRDKISQVLANLVNNSLKLTEKGNITISTTKGNNVIQISVKDTGPGIKEEDMPRLFQQYEQLERKAGGTGLGLAISLEIIKAHGGKIWAESTFGHGTTMHFLLPIEERRRRP
ncbi:MAG: PAS domain-containing sensor histidine kinase [Candidatus Omnitrophota bacterium]